MDFKQNIDLQSFNTFGLSEKAAYYFEFSDISELKWALENRPAQELLILGGGSNILASDKGFSGLVIQVQDARYQIQGTKVHAQVGVPMATLVQETGRRGLSGLEWAGGLPPASPTPTPMRARTS
mgnify:CR=1 FL=1